MLEDVCERYEPDNLLCFEPLDESIGFWKKAGIWAWESVEPPLDLPQDPRETRAGHWRRFGGVT